MGHSKDKYQYKQYHNKYHSLQGQIIVPHHPWNADSTYPREIYILVTFI